jgi:hypothetical protein
MNDTAHPGMKRIKTLGLFFGALAFFFIAAEIIFGAFYHEGDENYGMFPQGALCRRDALLGWIGRPNKTGLWRPGGPNMENMLVEMNREGFWDRNHSVSVTGGRKRILFLGDSFTIGYGVTKEQRFTDIIEKTLFGRYDVMNMGMWGYSTDQEFLLFKEKGLVYRPDVVVLVTFMDDLFNVLLFSVNEGRYIKPRFVFGKKDYLELKNTPVPNNRGISHLLNLIVTRSVQLRNRFAVGSEFMHLDWYSIFDKRFLKEKRFSMFLGLLREIHAEARSRGMHFLLVLIPYKDQLYEEQIRSSGGDYMGIPMQRLALRQPQQVINFFCRQEGIPILDLMSHFKKKKYSEKYFFKGDLHWTPEGHLFAADMMINRLTSLGYVR